MKGVSNERCGKTQRDKNEFMFRPEDRSLLLKKGKDCATGPLHIPCRPRSQGSLLSDMSLGRVPVILPGIWQGRQPWRS